LEAQGCPEDLKLAAIYVNDTLHLAWLSAQSIFQDKATPEIALAIYDRFVQRVGRNPGPD
ncbi:MAG TPA: hypothetical protein VEG60_10545, partial [Candidatus Binatia bacterium]|nr:hypothetical protein [Candidatus Binatia bacterium]